MDNHSGEVLQDLPGCYVRIDIDLIHPQLPQGVEMVTHMVVRVVIAALILPRGKGGKKLLFRLEKKTPVKLGREQSCQVAGQGKPSGFNPRGLPQPPEEPDGSVKPAFDQ